MIYIDGRDPDVDEVGRIIGEFGRATGVCLAGNPVERCRGDGDLVEGYGTFLVDLYERQGKLSRGASDRTIVRRLTVDGVGRVVAAVLTREFNAWVRDLVPRHLERVTGSGNAVALRPAFSRLGDDSALSFVAGARDGETLQFGDLQITVSLFPETDPRRIRALMPGGEYTQLLAELGIREQLAAGASPGAPDIAHWLLCADGQVRAVHLGYFFPSGTGRTGLLPYDVLSPTDQQSLKRFIF
ncbi:hypothetical protein [Streptomyces sp. NPDC102437]|uniref:hypothetical protein n=1 Tax=Streptomyces sp. NPDC102437 TaxID=3366175 RepID=UPI0037FFEDB8